MTVALRRSPMRLGVGGMLLSLVFGTLGLAASAPAPVAAATQSISIRPTQGSATQSIKVTFVADQCVLNLTDEIFWDGTPIGITAGKPPSCEVTFTAIPAYGHRGPGRHKLCVGQDVISCATFTILGPKPTPRPTPKPTPRPTAKASPIPTPLPSLSPSPMITPPPSEPAIALASASPTPAPAPSGANAAPPVGSTGAGGAYDPAGLLVVGVGLIAGLVTGFWLVVRRVRGRSLRP